MQALLTKEAVPCRKVLLNHSLEVLDAAWKQAHIRLHRDSRYTDMHHTCKNVFNIGTKAFKPAESLSHGLCKGLAQSYAQL